MRNRRNYYRILHVQSDAPVEIIQMSYLTLMRRLRMHPDLGGDHATAALINEAYATLKDPVRRAEYDRTFRQRYARATVLEGQVIATGAPSPDLCRCAFCDTPHSEQAIQSVSARCDVCQSPLHPVDRLLSSASARRTLDRLDRRLAFTASPAWSPGATFAGMTEDISIAGMLLLTAFELLADDRIQLDCAFCSAVCVVRHVNPASSADQWRVGVEFLAVLLHEPKGGIVSTRA